MKRWMTDIVQYSWVTPDTHTDIDWMEGSSTMGTCGHLQTERNLGGGRLWVPSSHNDFSSPTYPAPPPPPPPEHMYSQLSPTHHASFSAFDWRLQENTPSDKIIVSESFMLCRTSGSFCHSDQVYAGVKKKKKKERKTSKPPSHFISGALEVGNKNRLCCRLGSCTNTTSSLCPTFFSADIFFLLGEGQFFFFDSERAINKCEAIMSPGIREDVHCFVRWKHLQRSGRSLPWWRRLGCAFLSDASPDAAAAFILWRWIITHWCCCHWSLSSSHEGGQYQAPFSQSLHPQHATNIYWYKTNNFSDINLFTMKERNTIIYCTNVTNHILMIHFFKFIWTN